MELAKLVKDSALCLVENILVWPIKKLMPPEWLMKLAKQMELNQKTKKVKKARRAKKVTKKANKKRTNKKASKTKKAKKIVKRKTIIFLFLKLCTIKNTKNKKPLFFFK